MNIPAVPTQHRELQSITVVMEHKSELTMAIITGWMSGCSRCGVLLLTKRCSAAALTPLPPSRSLYSLSHRWSLALQGNHRDLWVPQSSDDAAHISVWGCVDKARTQQWLHTDLFVSVFPVVVRAIRVSLIAMSVTQFVAVNAVRPH